jgi:putative transposase
MPNHIHILLWVRENKDMTDNGQSRTPVPTNVERANSTCSQFVSTFKRFCNKEYGENIWQARFYDHIIRNHKDFENHLKYIYENPIQWYFDELYSDE